MEYPLVRGWNVYLYVCENSAPHRAVINNITAPACRLLYDVVASALMVIRHDSEETSN